MEQAKIGSGLILLAVSSAFLYVAGGFDTTFRLALGLWAVMGLAAGSVLLGTAKSVRPA